VVSIKWLLDIYWINTSIYLKGLHYNFTAVFICPSSAKTFPHHCSSHKVAWIPGHPHGTTHCKL